MALNASSRSSTLHLDYDSRSSASRSRFIKDRVTHVEKSFGSICDSLGAVARKNGKLRDKNDQLCHQLLDYAETVTYNSSSKESISQVTKDLACCNDYQDAMVKRIEAQVVEPMRIFDTVIKDSREEIQKALAAYDKEQKSKKHVDSMREKNPSDRHRLNQAEEELNKAKVQASRSAKALEEAVDTFEQRKLNDLKKILGNHIRIQMAFHAKSLECLTKAYKNLGIYDAENDLEEFRNVLHPTSAIERQQMLMSSHSRQSLTSETSTRSARGRDSLSPAHTPAQPSSHVNMFTTQTAKPNISSQSAPTRPASTPDKSRTSYQPATMLGDESDSEDEETDSDPDEVHTYADVRHN